MKRKKILINADATVNNNNAQNRNGKLWAIHLSKEKYDVYIFSSDSAFDPRIKETKGLKIINSRRSIKLIFFFIRHFIFSPFDFVLNSKVSPHLIGYIKFKKLFNRKTRLITFIVNQVPYGEVGSKYTKQSDYIILHSDLQIANSEFVRKMVMRYYEKEIPVINNFIDTRLFKPTEKRKSEDSIKVVCVASMICVKQPFLFANIAKQLPGVDFLWIGGRYYLEDLKEKKENEGIDNLTLIEKIDNNELPKVLSDQDIFLMTSIQEGFANVILEALACGLPVIAFNRYMPDAIVDGETGFIVSDEFEMLQKLKFLMENRDMLQEFKTKAVLRAKSYEAAENIGRLEKILDNE